MPPEIDLYCERVTAWVFDEPLGLISNVAFLVAAWVLYKQPKGQNRSLLLIGLLTAIGLGSGAFHAFATRLTLWMDVIPIQLFILSAIWLLYYKNLQWPRWGAALALILFLGLSAAVPRGLLQGSASYIPAWLFLATAAFLHAPGPGRTVLVNATALFPISLTFRTLDLPLCGAIPVGTHFMWHLCNALVLYWVVRATQYGAMELGDPRKPTYTQAGYKE